MSVYSMAQVSSLTGISAHTLRIWERRYNFLKPNRTDTNIRYYSDVELVKLLNVGILIRNGTKVSKIDMLTDSELYKMVADLLNNSSSNQDEIDSLTMSMLDMNEDKFDSLFQRQVGNIGFLRTIIEIIYPFLNRIGVLWRTSKATPAQEHFASNLIRQKIIAEIDRLPSPSVNAPRILIFLLEGEDHEIGLLLASYIAKEIGLRTFYLGQNVPLENIDDALKISRAQCMLTMFVLFRPKKIVHFIKTIREFTSVPFYISGTPENFIENEECLDFDYITKPDELVAVLKTEIIDRAEMHNRKS